MNFQPVIEYIENILREEKGVPGCDLQIMHEHEVLLRYHSGVSDYEGNTPISGDELYFMYSCTKPITCTAAMQLVEKGIIGLDDPVSKYLPAFKDVFLIKDGKKVAPNRTMTVRHLFTMSAGFDYNWQTAPIAEVLASPLCTLSREKAFFTVCAMMFWLQSLKQHAACVFPII